MTHLRLTWIVPAIVLACGGESTPSSPANVQPATTPTDSVPPPPQPPPPPNAARRDSLILRPGELVLVPNTNLALKFLDVPEDSRCPTGVQCVWEGNGAVRLEMGIAGGPSSTMTLNTKLEPRSVEFNGYTIRLLFLEPYPVYERPTSPAQYRAHVLIEAS